RLNATAELLDRWVEAGAGDRPCLITPAEALTYRELQARGGAIARVLVERLRPRSRGRGPPPPAPHAPRAGAPLPPLHAARRAGGVAVATMPLLRAKELVYPIQKAKVALALCDARLADELRKAQEAAPELARIVTWGDGAEGSLEALLRAAGEVSVPGGFRAC